MSCFRRKLFTRGVFDFATQSLPDVATTKQSEHCIRPLYSLLYLWRSCSSVTLRVIVSLGQTAPARQVSCILLPEALCPSRSKTPCQLHPTLSTNQPPSQRSYWAPGVKSSQHHTSELGRLRCGLAAEECSAGPLEMKRWILWHSYTCSSN